METQGGTRDELDNDVYRARFPIPAASNAEHTPLNRDEVEMRHRIDRLVDSVKDDRQRSHQLFQYVWTMICVRQGLMRIVREVETGDATQIVVEEVRTGQRRIVSRPKELDTEMEGLAVQALARILNEKRRVS